MRGFKSTLNGSRSAVALCSMVVLGGCGAMDNLLTVDLPGKVDARDLESPGSASLLVSSVRNEFRCAFTHYVNVSAFVGTEFAVPQNNAGMLFYDQRRWTDVAFPAVHVSYDCESANPAMYLTLSRSRWLADDVLTRLDGWGAEQVTNKGALEAETAAYSGYSYVMLGEGMCSVAFDLGEEKSPADAFNLAVSRFDQGIAAAGSAGRSNFQNLARVGKARALLNLGRLAEAAEVAAQVPEGFAFEMAYSGSSDVTYNKQHQLNFQNDAATVEVGYRNMRFAGVPDPRVQVTNAGINGPGGGLPIWTADKYDQLDSPIQLATWEEAQLIVAEAAVAAGRLQEAVDIINTLHGKVGLPSFESTDAAEIKNQIIYERRAELFLEGQHLMDMKRYDLPFLPAAGAPFAFGGDYGDLTCFPLPAVEYFNNPSIADDRS